MKRGFLLGIFLAFFLCIQSAYADNFDPLALIQGDFIGVGSIDMQKMPERKIYSHLMALFATDKGAKSVLEALEKNGMNYKSLRRLIVGIPENVEKGEYLLFWEATENVEKYQKVLDAFSNDMEKRSLDETDYYCLKTRNACLMFSDYVVIQGSQRVIEDTIRKSKKADCSPINSELVSRFGKVDKSKDAWIVFWLTQSARKRIGQGDPILDMTKEGKGKLMLGAIQGGQVSLDFSTGLNSVITLDLVAVGDSKAFSDILQYSLEQARADESVKELEITDLMDGIKVVSDKKQLKVQINYSADTFEKLISVVSELLKSVAHEGIQGQK